jgi:hypothetical protein
MKTFRYSKQTWLIAAATFSLTACEPERVPGSTAAGRITTSATWGGMNCPVTVTDDVFVEGPDAPVLTIEAGCEVSFASGKGLFIGRNGPGALKLEGTSEQRVLLTGQEKTAGAWRGVQLLEHTDVEKTKLTSATIEFAGASPSLGSVQIHGVRPVLEDVLLQSGARHGIAIESGGFGASTGHLAISGHGGYAVRLPASAAGSVPAVLSLEGNAGAIEVTGGLVNRPVSWRAHEFAYDVTGDIDVRGDESAVLTLEAGAELRFAPGVGLSIASGGEAGALAVNGTAEKPVSFRPLGDAVRGAWRGISFHRDTLDDQSALTHAVIENAGGARLGACMTLERATVTLRDVTISGCDGHGLSLQPGALLGAQSARLKVSGASQSGVHLEAASVHTLPAEGSDYSGNRVGVEIAGGAVSESATWKALNTPYVVSSSFAIGGTDRPVLRLEPGVMLRFRSDTGLSVGQDGLPGGLTAIGSQRKPITFTAHGQQLKGEWLGIHFTEATLNAESILAHTMIEWAGGGALTGSVQVTGASPVIRESLIWRGLDCGIRTQCTARGLLPIVTDVLYGEGADGNDAGSLCGC